MNIAALEAMEEATAGARPGVRCKLSIALDSADTDTRETVVEALRRRTTITSTKIAEWISAERSVDLDEQMIRRHRLGKCKCQYSTS